MLSLKRSKKVINIVIEDYILRIIETNGHDISTVKLFEERIVPSGLIEHGKITDEIAFYEFMKELVKELGFKNRQVRFNVPNSIVIMRQVDLPTNLKGRKEINEYLEMEIGKSIHLPFQEPIFDFPDIEVDMMEIHNEKKQLTLFAAPGGELRKYTEIFADVGLKPISADVGILGNYRYFYYMHQVSKEQVYLIVEINMSSIHLGIFQDHQLEFLRYQDLDVELATSRQDAIIDNKALEYTQSKEVIKGLMQDQVNELERVMNFYRFSLHKGEKMVTNIILLGDYPSLGDIYKLMKNRYDEISIARLHGHLSQTKDKEINAAFIPALGLAIKGAFL